MASLDASKEMSELAQSCAEKIGRRLNLESIWRQAIALLLTALLSAVLGRLSSTKSQTPQQPPQPPIVVVCGCHQK
jgi:hypothetical protein